MGSHQAALNKTAKDITERYEGELEDLREKLKLAQQEVENGHKRRQHLVPPSFRN